MVSLRSLLLSRKAPPTTNAILGVAPHTSCDVWNATLIAKPKRHVRLLTVLFVVSLLTNSYLSFCLVTVHRRIKHIPMVAVLDGTGHVRAAGVTTPLSPELAQSQAQITAFLTEFIRRAREIAEDEVVVAKWAGEARSYLVKNKSEKKFVQWARSARDGTLNRMGKVTVQTQLLSIARIPGTQSYEARWQEQVYDTRHELQDSYVMNGFFNVAHIDTNDLLLTEKERLSLFHVNPLGLYITDFNWSRQL